MGEEMKPTDEAKRLRDEIAKKEFESHYLNDYEISWLVNKVLDVAVDGLESVHNPCQVVSTPAFLRIRNDVIKLINKLRP